MYLLLGRKWCDNLVLPPTHINKYYLQISSRQLKAKTDELGLWLLSRRAKTSRRSYSLEGLNAKSLSDPQQVLCFVFVEVKKKPVKKTDLWGWTKETDMICKTMQVRGVRKIVDFWVFFCKWTSVWLKVPGSVMPCWILHWPRRRHGWIDLTCTGRAAYPGLLMQSLNEGKATWEMHHWEALAQIFPFKCLLFCACLPWPSTFPWQGTQWQ